MREPNRLYGFYDKLRDIHIKYFPDWRFGQLCSNVMGWIFSKKKCDPFFLEEDTYLRYMEEFANQFGLKES